MTEFKHTPDSLADELDQIIPPGSHLPAESVDEPLIESAARLANAPRPALSASARARIHASLLQQAPVQKPLLRPDFSGLLRWGLVASVVVIVLFVPAVQVTLASVPGEIFYPLKQTLEQLEFNFATNPESQVVVNLTHAERRTHEAETLLARGQFNPDHVATAYRNLADAATLVRSDADFNPEIRLRAELQTVALTAVINQLLVTASETDPSLYIPVATRIAVTRDSGSLLLPAPVSITATPTETVTPAPTLTPTDISTVTPSLTAAHTPTTTSTETETPLSTSTPTVPPTVETNLVIEGPVEAISGNIVTIYGIEITFDPGDPLLLVLQIGDKIRVSGNATEPAAGTVIISSIEASPADDSLAVSEDGQSAWRDTGNCDNPPPPWATANGWRARCEGQSGSSASPGQGNQGNNGNNGSRGRGNNNGNSSDDDDD